MEWWKFLTKKTLENTEKQRCFIPHVNDTICILTV